VEKGGYPDDFDDEHVLSFYRSIVVRKVAKASGLTEEQVELILEVHKSAKEADFTIPMPKLKRFKIKEDPEELAKQWKEKVNFCFVC